MITDVTDPVGTLQSNQNRSMPVRGRPIDLRLNAVVPARNAGAHLELCLKALLRAGLESDQIIVVDDASDDETGLKARHLDVKVIELTTRLGPAGARNAGVKASHAEVILFVDADVVVYPDVWAKVRAALKEPGIAAVFGSYDRFPPAGGLVSRYRNLLHHFTHQAGRPEAQTFWTGCGAIRRRPLLEVGGFDESPCWEYVEDVELGARLRAAGWRIRLDPDMLCTHLKAWSLLSALRTDLLHRAIPWSRLILERGDHASDLSLGYRQRLAVGLTAAVAAALLLAPVWLEAGVVALLALAGVMLANASFLNFLRRTSGLWFALGALPLHLAHHFAAGLGLAYALLEAGARSVRRFLVAGWLPARP